MKLPSRLIDFLFLRLSLETASAMGASYVGVHWIAWRTFDLPPYRVLASLGAAVHVPGEILWGAPLVVLGGWQLVAAWRDAVGRNRIVARALAVYLLFVAVVMLGTLPRSIVAWFMIFGAYLQLSVYTQLPLDAVRCSILPALAGSLLAEGFDKESITYLGIAAAVVIAVIPAIDTVKKWGKGGEQRVTTQSPVVVAAQPVFATVEVVDRVDRELNGKFDKLDKYVHDFVHDHTREMQGISALIREIEEAQRENFDAINSQGEQRITKVHDRLNEVVRDIGGLEATSQSTANAIVRVQQTLENILGRIPQPPRGGTR